MLSTVVNIVPREFAGISECLLQHFLCKLVVMFVLERLVVEAYGLVELSAEMVNEAKGEVSLRVRRVETDALLEVANGFLVVPELATGVCEVCQYSLHNPVACVWLAQHECLIVVSLGLLVEFLLVVDNSEFRVNERIGRVYLLGLEQRQCGGFQIVGSQILHAHVEMRLCTAWEETHDSAINGHGLVGLVLNCKGMRHSNPCEHERLVQHYGLLEILASDLELFAVEVVSADCEPTYWMGRVALH